jgi:hypothetical protein
MSAMIGIRKARTHHRNVLYWGRRALLAGSFALAAIVGTASASDAAAWGTTTWGGSFCLFGHCTPGGTQGINVQGDGLTVTSVTSGFQAFFPHGPLCNWWIDINFYDTAGQEYFHQQGDNHWSCDISGGQVLSTVPMQAQTGQVCAIVYSNSGFVSRACLNVHP